MPRSQQARWDGNETPVLSSLLQMGALPVLARRQPVHYGVGFERRFSVVGLVSGLPLECSPEQAELSRPTLLVWGGGLAWEGWA